MQKRLQRTLLYCKYNKKKQKVFFDDRILLRLFYKLSIFVKKSWNMPRSKKSKKRAKPKPLTPFQKWKAKKRGLKEASPTQKVTEGFYPYIKHKCYCVMREMHSVDYCDCYTIEMHKTKLGV
jgi:hypothetical protein